MVARRGRSVTVYGELVERHGLAVSHALVLAAVPDGCRVLDIGCADGYLARELAGRGCTVVGVEVDPRAAARAERWCAAIVCGDVEDPQLRTRIGGEFDRVLMADVLEHLRDPGTIVRWARDRLAGDGRAVVSLPNIGHWTARRQLVRGRFPQDDYGLFDRTHLRFFTRESARSLVRGAGLVIDREAFVPAPVPLESRIAALGRLRPALVRRLPEVFALQFVLTCATAHEDRVRGDEPAGQD